jgi:hypothetical protein
MNDLFDINTEDLLIESFQDSKVFVIDNFYIFIFI